ncbi:MAG: dihydrofolate reductase [Gammaproteobacteria bacterium]|nr:MAG: dihydrofolate reductase [Gammaproteobacteria bacterium]
MRIAMIAAMAQNRVIGRNNKLPWYLPEDLKYFKRITMGKPMIMGRKTFESIGKPLPGRATFVVTRNPDWTAEGVTVVPDLRAALRKAEAWAECAAVDEVIVAGGGQIYTEALPHADRLYLTQVHADVAGDAWFPAFDESEWAEVSREDFVAADPNPYDYSFRILDRCR